MRNGKAIKNLITAFINRFTERLIFDSFRVILYSAEITDYEVEQLVFWLEKLTIKKSIKINLTTNNITDIGF